MIMPPLPEIRRLSPHIVRKRAPSLILAPVDNEGREALWCGVTHGGLIRPAPFKSRVRPLIKKGLWALLGLEKAY